MADTDTVLSAPSGQGGGGQIMPDGRRPESGGWNRISLTVTDLQADVERLRAAGVPFGNDVVVGVGGNHEHPDGQVRPVAETFARLRAVIGDLDWVA